METCSTPTHSRTRGIFMAINVTDLNNRCVTTSTVGYMALALTSWMLSMTAAGWYPQIYSAGSALMLPFALLLTIIGILPYLHGRSLDSIVFFAFAVLFTAGHSGMAAIAAGAPSPMSYVGWFWIVWTDLRALQLISGYLGLISAIIAATISASDVILFGREAHSPNDDHVDHAAGHPHTA